MTDTTQTQGQVIAQTAIATIEAMAPALVAGTSADPRVAAAMQTVSLALEVLKQQEAAGSAVTPEQLAALWSQVTESVKAAHDAWNAAQAPTAQ